MKNLLAILGLVATTSSIAHAQESDLSVENTGPAQADADTDVTFDVTVTNLGPDAADVGLNDPLPSGLTFVSMTGSACTTPAVGASGPITCDIPQLASGQAAVFSFVVHIDPAAVAGTFFTTIATVSTTTPDPNSENDSATAVVQTPPPPSADVGVTKLGPNATNPDTDVTYTIEVTNGGPGDATHVDWTDALPANLTFVSVDQDGGPTFGCGAVSAGFFTCSIATLGAGAAAKFILVLHVPANATDGTTYQNLATVVSDHDPNSENDASSSFMCVQQDSCAAGPCNSNVAVVCAATTDPCQEQPTCNTVSGVCQPNPKADDAACDDGDACTQTDTCQSGVCTGGDPVVCPSAGQCETQGACDAATGECAANANAADDTACDDGDACTQSDSCVAGECVGSDQVVCDAASQCEKQGKCNPNSGVCAPNTAKRNGTKCNDGDACTTGDVCESGECAGQAKPKCGNAGNSGRDSGIDAGTTDAGGDHTGGNDAAVSDKDASTGAAGTPGKGAAGMTGHATDAGAAGADLVDAGADASTDIKHDNSGCSCRVGVGAAPRPVGAWWTLLGLVGAVRVFRRRRAMRSA